MLTKVLIKTTLYCCKGQGVFVGFLKFLNRDKKKEDLGDLDLPPAPPPLDDFDKSLDFNIPEIGKEKLMDSHQSMPDFEFSDKDEIMPDFPNFPKMEDMGEELVNPPMSEAPPEESPSMPQPAASKPWTQTEPDYKQVNAAMLPEPYLPKPYQEQEKRFLVQPE